MNTWCLHWWVFDSHCTHTSMFHIMDDIVCMDDNTYIHQPLRIISYGCSVSSQALLASLRGGQICYLHPSMQCDPVKSNATTFVETLIVLEEQDITGMTYARFDNGSTSCSAAGWIPCFIQDIQYRNNWYDSGVNTCNHFQWMQIDSLCHAS
jgi:hypothetical protein